MRDEEFDEARKAGVTFYDHPDKLTYDQIDPLFRPIVSKINATGFAWTAECCQGHPEAASPPWSHNVRPMLRLVTKIEHAGIMLVALVAGALSKDMDDGSPNGVMLRDNYGAWEIWPRKVAAPWFEVLVYWRHATTVFDRNCGLAAFDRFADELAKTRVFQFEIPVREVPK